MMEVMIPDNLHDYAAALIRDLENDGRAICRIMHVHLWLMLTSDTPDDGALYTDVNEITSWLKG